MSSTECSMLKVAGIVGDSIVDGPGLRTAVFLQGCPHACPGCHNPETWPDTGGEEYTADALYDIIRKNPLSKAVTLSGGEPLCQAEALLPLVRRLEQDGYEVAIYTGYVYEELMRSGTDAQHELLRYADVLIDGPFIQAEFDPFLRFRGSKNQRIIDLKESEKTGDTVLVEGTRWTGKPQ